MNKAKDCPFCGSNETKIDCFTLQGRHTFYIKCKVCDTKGPKRDRLLEAMFEWNNLKGNGPIEAESK